MGTPGTSISLLVLHVRKLGLTATSVSGTRPWSEEGTELGWERILSGFKAQTVP